MYVGGKRVRFLCPVIGEAVVKTFSSFPVRLNAGERGLRSASALESAGRGGFAVRAFLCPGLTP